MASKLPYFKWYPKDAQSDIRYCSMTDQELGLYHRCLNLSWVNSGLPSELSELAEALGKPLEYLERMWPRISKCFILLSKNPAKYVNPRQERERLAASELSDKRSSAGKQGGRPQKQKLSKTKANPYGSGSISESISEEGGAGETKLPAGYAMDEQYENFRAAILEWGCNVIDEDFIAAWPAWRVLDGLQRAAAVDGIKARAAAGIAPDYAKGPRNYLHGHEWKRAIKIPNGKRPRGLTAEEIAAL